MSRKKNAFWGFLFDVGGTAVLQVVTFVVTPLYLGFTTNELYGYWLTIGSILSWLYLSDFGVGMALSRYIIFAIEKNDKKLLNDFIRNAFILFLIVSIVFIVIGVSFSKVFINWFDVKPEHLRAFRITYFTTIITGALGLPLSIFWATLEAFQKISFNRVMTSVSSLIGIGVTMSLLIAGLGLVSFSFGMVITLCTNFAGSFIYFNKVNPTFNFYPFKLQKDVVKKLMNFGGFFQVGKLANTVATNTDNIIIASFLGAAMVSIYAFTSKLAILFSVTFISKLPGALFPGISQLVEQKNSEGIRKTYISLLKLSLRIALISSTFVFVVNERFVSAWVGNENYGGDTLNYVWVYLVFFDCIIRGISVFIFSLGQLKGWAITSLIEVVLNIVISVSLINKFGLMGVAIGTAISRTLTIGIYTPIFIQRHIELRAGEILNTALLPTILRSLPAIAITVILAQINFQINDWVWMAGIGFILVFINFLFFEFPYLKRLNGLSLKDKIIALRFFY